MSIQSLSISSQGEQRIMRRRTALLSHLRRLGASLRLVTHTFLLLRAQGFVARHRCQHTGSVVR